MKEERIAENIIGEFNKCIEDAWLNQPEDIKRMLAFNDETNRNFAVALYANGFFDNNAEALYSYYLFAKAGKGDFETFQNIVVHYLEYLSSTTKTDYHMIDVGELLSKCANVFRGIDNYEQAVQLLLSVQKYFVRLFYWADLAMPWSAVSDTYNRMKPIQKKVLEGGSLGQ